MAATVSVSEPPAPALTPARAVEKRFSIATLGCKVNAFESELIAQQLTKQRYRRVHQNDPADLCLINTCTVTAEADRQARQLVRRRGSQQPGSQGRGHRLLRADGSRCLRRHSRR